MPENSVPELRVHSSELYQTTWEHPLRWYAVHTRSNYEKKVAEDFVIQKVDGFLPMVREVHVWKDRKKTVDVPIFPGYVFAHIADHAADRLKILRSPGTVRILGQGSHIEPIPDVEIESVRQLVDAKVAFSVHPFLREGAWVRVKRGPLAGVEGLLVRVKSHCRLVLSIHLLARSVSTEISVHDVEVVRSALSSQASC